MSIREMCGTLFSEEEISVFYRAMNAFPVMDQSSRDKILEFVKTEAARRIKWHGEFENVCK